MNNSTSNSVYMIINIHSLYIVLLIHTLEYSALLVVSIIIDSRTSDSVINMSSMYSKLMYTM